jgi:large subunit ribosomal protein L5
MTEQLTPESEVVETAAAEDETTMDEPMAAADEPMPSAETPVEAQPATDEAATEPVAEAAPEIDAAPAPDAAPETEAAPEPVAAPAAEPEPEREAAPKRGERKPPVGVDASERPPGPRGLQLKYRTDVVPALVKQFEYKNPNQVPRLEKIVVNVGLGEALTNAKAIDAASGDLTTITGQKPIVMKARRSIAQFRVRTGNPIGLKVTLRGERMWDFLERLTVLTLPRIRDFRGIPGKSFDGRGNYTLGLREQIAFPEIDYDKVDRLRGLEISIVTTAKSDEESKRMLELLGMPFAS